MARSLKKGPFVDQKLLEKVIAQKEAGTNKPIKTWSRDCTVVPEFVGIKFAVHNGKTFVEILVAEDMVGNKLGEFAPTTKFKSHGGKNA